MSRDAESHADEDRKKKQLAEARNEADTLIYSVEKSKLEYGDKLTDSEKKDLEEALERCKKVKDTSMDAAELKEASQKLMTASHKIAEHVYKTSGQQSGQRHGQQTGQEKPGEEKVVDAEFEEVNKKEK